MFLFGQDTVFPMYANLIGSSAESIRDALLSKPKGILPVAGSAFSEFDRRTLQGRVMWYRKEIKDGPARCH